jgi:hypothetical protein
LKLYVDEPPKNLYPHGKCNNCVVYSCMCA